MRDKQLLKLLKKSPSDGLQEAIRLYGRPVETICTNILGINRREDIEECISDVFVKLWNGLDHFEPSRQSSLKSYIYGIARFTAIDRRRRLGRTDDPILPIEENDLGLDVDFAEEASKHINEEIIRQAVGCLPSPDYEIFVYRYFFYEAVAEIALQLGLPAKTVENKLYRGKRKLKQALLERGIIL